RIRGWLGRADESTNERGMFVKPAQMGEVAKRHPEIRKYRLVVDQDPKKNDRMTLNCEIESVRTNALALAITESIRAVCNLRGEVAFQPSGSLPNDGKVIEDARKYE